MEHIKVTVCVILLPFLLRRKVPCVFLCNKKHFVQLMCTMCGESCFALN